MTRRDFRLDDALRQTFDDRGFTDPGFADQHRIVFRAATENLQYTFNLVRPADDRIELAFLGHLRQVTTELIECGCIALAVAFPGSRFSEESDRQLSRGQQISAKAAEYLSANAFLLT